MSKKGLIIVFFAIFLVNIGYAFVYQIQPKVDAAAYNHIAQNLVTYHVYVEDPANVQDVFVDNSIGRIGPGYEFFLAAIYNFFGQHFWIVWVLQALFYSASIIMLALIALDLFPELTARPKLVYGAVLFWGIFIDAVQLNAMLMTESLFTFLMVLGLYLFYRYMYRTVADSSDNGKKIGTLGFVFGLLTLVRPTGLLLFGVLMLFLWFFRPHLRRYVVFGVLVFSALQVPWVARNYSVYGQFLPHTTADGMNLLSGNYPGNHGEFRSFDFLESLYAANPAPTEFKKAATDWYIHFWETRPFQAASILMEKSVIFFSLTKTSGFWFHYFSSKDQIVTVALSVFENALIIGGFFVFVILLGRDFLNKKRLNQIQVLFIGIILSVVASPIITIISNRYRLPPTVFSLLLVAYSYVEMKKLEKKAMVFIIGLAGAALLFMTLTDLSLQFGKFQERLQRVSVETHI